MEFKEYSNPEGKDYDIISSLNSVQNSTESLQNEYSFQLAELIGILDDVTEENLQEQYGISMNEYLKPTAETIVKVTQRLNNESKLMHR